MKVLVTLVTLVTVSSGLNTEDAYINPVFGYLKNVGIPEAERIRNAEEESFRKGLRIVGGETAAIQDNPWQAGLLVSLIGVNGQSVCGASLVSNERLVTAAHCWSDGLYQGYHITVVLGSSTLFYGGERLGTNIVVLHPEWNPSLVRNDIAVIYLQEAVATSEKIAPIALPSGSELSDTFNDKIARVSGFGMTSDSDTIGTTQALSQLDVPVMSNTLCMVAYPMSVRATNICTRGTGAVGPCAGDSGGPLVIYSNNRYILIGVTTFRSLMGCEVGMPGVYSRVTSYVDFINDNIL